jgi:hypothetical protein
MLSECCKCHFAKFPPLQQTIGIASVGVCFFHICIPLFQLRLSPEQSGKVEYERERLLGIPNKFINFLAIPSSLSRSYSTFPLCSGTTLVETAAYSITVFWKMMLYTHLANFLHQSHQCCLLVFFQEEDQLSF